jgi:hypothetical protein
MVMNTAFGKPEDLPFDLRKRRVLCYQALPSQRPAEARTKLVAALQPALRAALSAATKDRLLPHTKKALVSALQPFSGRKVGLWTSLPDREDWKDRNALTPQDGSASSCQMCRSNLSPSVFSSWPMTAILRLRIRTSVRLSGLLRRPA